MIQDIAIPFIAVGIAELGDKTQLAVLGLASKTRQHLKLFLAVVLAFMVADGLAILLGSFISKAVPLSYIKIASGITFIIFGVMMLHSKEEEKEDYELRNVFMSSFWLVLISEMGDKTQISSALFAAKFEPALVFIGVIAALAALSVAAIFIGRLLMERIDKKMLSRCSGLLFIALGLASFLP